MTNKEWLTLVLNHTAGLDTIFIQIYMNVPPGVPGVSKELEGTRINTFSPNWTNFQKPHKIKKIYQKWLFSDGFSKFVQFGLNIKAKTYQVIYSLVLPFLLTPLAPCIHSEDIMVFCFWYFWVVAPPKTFFQINQNKYEKK